MDLFVYITFPSIDEARTLGRALIDARLAGCVNIIPSMESIYLWNDDVMTDTEVIMVAKSTSDKMADLTTFVKAHHSYSIPCIATIEVKHQNLDYADWLHKNLLTSPNI